MFEGPDCQAAAADLLMIDLQGGRELVVAHFANPNVLLYPR